MKPYLNNLTKQSQEFLAAPTLQSPARMEGASNKVSTTTELPISLSLHVAGSKTYPELMRINGLKSEDFSNKLIYT